MATHVTVIYGDKIIVDYNNEINWADKGTSFPALPNTVHAVIWNDLIGQNEVQFKNASTGDMTGNTDLNATSDTVHGSITVQNLLNYCDTRIAQINQAKTDFEAAGAGADGTASAGKTWVDYDPNYSE
jgi:hypothetical protein